MVPLLSSHTASWRSPASFTWIARVRGWPALTARSKNSQGLLGIPTVTFLHEFLHQYHAFPTEEDSFQFLSSCHLTATDIHVHRPQTFMFIDPNLTPLKPSLNKTCTFGQVFKNSCLFCSSSDVGKVNCCPTGFCFRFAFTCRPSQSMLNLPKTFYVAHKVMSFFLVSSCMQWWRSTLYPLSKSSSNSGMNQKSELEPCFAKLLRLGQGYHQLRCLSVLMSSTIASTWFGSARSYCAMKTCEALAFVLSTEKIGCQHFEPLWIFLQRPHKFWETTILTHSCL